MADLMEQHRWPLRPALQFGDQVMQALFRLFRDRAQAQRANRIGHRSARVLWSTREEWHNVMNKQQETT